MKRSRVLNLAERRKDRIDDADDFTKMIFTTEKCFWEEYERAALNDEQVIKLDQIIPGAFKSFDKVYTSVRLVLYTFKALFSQINSYEKNNISGKTIKNILRAANVHTKCLNFALRVYLSPCLNESIINC